MRKISKNPEHPLVILRIENNLSQAELAESLAVDEKYISMIECGKRSVSRKLAEKISEKYGYRIDWLLGASPFKTDKEVIQYAHGEAQTFDSPLEFEKAWIRGGGGAHPLTNSTVVEARLAVAIEQMNKDGWIVAVDMVESLLKIPAFKKNGKEGGNDNEV